MSEYNAAQMGMLSVDCWKNQEKSISLKTVAMTRCYSYEEFDGISRQGIV